MVCLLTVSRGAAAGAAILAGVLALTSPASAQEAQGRAAFATNCAVCHNAARGAPAKVGPNLFGIVGRTAATVPGFSYSPAMQNSHIVWSVPRLTTYLQHPAQVVPGTRMPFAGLPAAQAAAVAAYLATLH